MTLRIRPSGSGCLPVNARRPATGTVDLSAPLTTARDYGKLGHFIVSAPIIFLSVSLSSSPSLSCPFFSLYLNYFSPSPLFPSSASFPILIALLAKGHRRNQTDLVLTAAPTITSPPSEEYLTATEAVAEGRGLRLCDGGKTITWKK